MRGVSISEVSEGRWCNYALTYRQTGGRQLRGDGERKVRLWRMCRGKRGNEIYNGMGSEGDGKEGK